MKAFKFFWTDPIALVSSRMSSRITRSVFRYWCWECCAEAIDEKGFSPRRLELRTLCVCGTRDNHYTIVTLWNFSRHSSDRWLCNMLVVDVKAVSSNGLLATTLVPNIYTRLDYQVGLVKVFCFPVRIVILSFWFFFLSFVFSFRCWSSLAQLKRKVWKLCDTAGVKCRLNACLHVKTSSHLRGCFTNGTLLSWIRLKRNRFCSLFSTLPVE